MLGAQLTLGGVWWYFGSVVDTGWCMVKCWVHSYYWVVCGGILGAGDTLGGVCWDVGCVVNTWWYGVGCWVIQF